MANRPPLRPSVVVSTYDNPRALALVLEALARQTIADFEILVADDGSGPETRETVERFAASARQRVLHLWQPDEGVRRCTIVNQAILAASGDYLVFLDGDCLVPAHWLAAHLRAAERGWFVAGGKVLMKAALTQQVLARHIDARTLESWTRHWHSIEKSRRLVISRVPLIRRLYNRNLQWRCGWVGEDSSTFANHLHRVGGFDERFTLVWEDADMSERLKASGVRGRSIRYFAPVLHLEHGRGYQNREQVQRNYELFRQNQADGVIITPYGLSLHR